jgi:hypothetical protein
MSKTQYALLVTFIGFYALLFLSLLVRACAGCFRARRTAAPKIEKVSGRVAGAKRRAWTDAVWRGNLMHEMREMKRAATVR